MAPTRDSTKLPDDRQHKHRWSGRHFHSTAPGPQHYRHRAARTCSSSGVDSYNARRQASKASSTGGGGCRASGEWRAGGHPALGRTPAHGRARFQFGGPLPIRGFQQLRGIATQTIAALTGTADSGLRTEPPSTVGCDRRAALATVLARTHNAGTLHHDERLPGKAAAVV